MEEPKKPKKTPKPAKRKPKKATSKKKADDSADAPLPPLPPMADYKALNMSALSAVLHGFDPKIQKGHDAVTHMGEQMQEYLSCYILIGYTVEGRAVNITYSPTSKDMDSLNTGLQRYIIDGPPRGFFGG